MNNKDNNMDMKKYNQLKEAEEDLVNTLRTILQNPEKEDELCEQVFNQHKYWLETVMPNYTAAIHRNIIEMYENDNRTKDYYDGKAGKGATKVLVRCATKYLAK